jgi:hypothetical protein
MDNKLAKLSHWSQILSFILALWLVVRPARSWGTAFDRSNMDYLIPTALVLSLILAGALHFAAVIVGRRPRVNESPSGALDKSGVVDIEVYNETLNELIKRESELKHWKGEAEREKKFRTEQVEVRDQRITEHGSTVTNLEQKLRVAQDKLEGFTSPRGRLKIKRGEYHMLGKVGLDVTEKLDQMILDDRLILAVRYNDVFFPDPMRGVRKHLTIDFSHGTREFSVTVPEDTKLTLPFPYADLA